MTKRRGPPRRKSVTCPMCGSRAVWEPSHGEYLCEGLLPPSESYAYSQPCPWSGTPDEIDDGRIRGPEDVAMRMAGALERISTDGRVSELDRATHSTYVDVVLENTSVEIMAADGWVAEQVSTELGRKIPRQHVARSRAKLEGLGYVRRLGVSDITRHGLRAAVKTRQVAGMRVPTLLEVRKAPPMPECEVCGADIPDGLRVLKRYCSTRCRVAAHRARDEVLAAAM